MAEFRVLVVDDDEPTNRLMKRYLGSMGLESEYAISGEDALEMLRRDPDGDSLVLLDLAMPIMNGYEVCRAIRGDPTLAHLPIVAFTARAGVESQERAYEAGVDDIILKPFQRADIVRVVERFSTPDM
jgi:CheY-like chemotaxis protein